MPNSAPWIFEPSWFSNDNLDMTGPRSFSPPIGWITVLFLRWSSNTHGPRTTELANHLDCLGALAKYSELCFAGVEISLVCAAEVVLVRHFSRCCIARTERSCFLKKDAFDSLNFRGADLVVVRASGNLFSMGAVLVVVRPSGNPCFRGAALDDVRTIGDLYLIIRTP